MLSMANSELYLAIARLARRFDMDSFQTTEENINVYRDQILPFPERGNFSIQATVKSLVEA